MILAGFLFVVFVVCVVCVVLVLLLRLNVFLLVVLLVVLLALLLAVPLFPLFVAFVAVIAMAIVSKTDSAPYDNDYPWLVSLREVLNTPSRIHVGIRDLSSYCQHIS